MENWQIKKNDLAKTVLCCFDARALSCCAAFSEHGSAVRIIKRERDNYCVIDVVRCDGCSP